jgi:ribosomal protein S18 acetylase RimI-like enzyme
MTYRITKATNNDLERLYAIDRAVIGGDSRRRLLTRAVAEGGCFVANSAAERVGFAVLETTFFGYAFISVLVVDPRHRRRGVATALVRYLELVSPTAKLFSSTNESNTIMQELFEKLGYIRSGYIENLDEGDPEIIYFKRSIHRSS